MMKWLQEKLMLLWPVRIWQQIFCLLILLAVVPLVVLGTLLMRTSQEAVRDSVLRDHQEISRRAAGEVSEFLRKPRELLVAVAAIIGVNHSDPWRQETAIVELALRYPMFRRIVTVDMNGQELASSRLGSRRSSWLDDPAFQRASAGEVFVSRVQIYGNDTPVIDIAVPVTRWGKTAGVLIAEVNLRGMWDIVDKINVGKTGYACVFDRSGALISHPDKKLVLGQGDPSGALPMGRILSGETGGEETVDSKNRKCLVSYSPVRDVGWGLVVFQLAEESYAFSKVMMIQSWSLILVSLLAAFLISLVLACLMSSPLSLLLEGARRISVKDFDHPIPVAREDEIGQILKSFNEMSLQLKRAQQSEKLSVIGRAAAFIVHELKNSLVLVDTHMQLLAEKKMDRAFMAEFAKVVPRELNAWKGMLQNMTDYSRLASFSMERMDVNAVVRDALDLVKPRAFQNKVLLAVDLAAEEPVLAKGNAGKLRQVVLNLLANALDVTPQGGRIRIATAVIGTVPGEAPGWAVIGVDNSGEVLPPDRMSRLFEPFFTTKDGGLGLGLAVCREIVERHLGTIHVVSDKVYGTSFRVHLPLDPNLLG